MASREISPTRQSSKEAGLYIEKLSACFDRRDNAERKTLPQEIELQYLVPRELGEVTRQGHPPIQLTTHYFSPKCPRTSDIVKTLRLGRVFYDAGQVARVRLRESIFTSGGREYLLELKGKKRDDGWGRISRPEISIGISEKVFRKLLPDASGGTTVKLRYGVPGFVFSADSGRVPVVLQLDEIQRAGRPPQWLDTPLYRADIEIPNAYLAEDLRVGRSTFSALLRDCVELSRLPKEATRQLSYTALAYTGCTQEVYQRCQQLLSAG
jgi:hypothetical protein